MTKSKNGRGASPIDPKTLNLDGFEVDLSSWKMGEYLDWEELFSNRSGSLRQSMEIMAQVIRRWPFAGDPSVFDSYRALDGADWALCYAAIQDATGKSFQLSLERRLQSDKVRPLGSGANGSDAAHPAGEERDVT
jgi:hypothetical protein